MSGTMRGTRGTKVNLTLSLFFAVGFIMAKAEDSYNHQTALQVLQQRCAEVSAGAE